MHRTIIASTLAALRSRVPRRIRAVVSGVAFWTAALMPVAYTPLVVLEHALVANPWTLAKLFLVNLLALVVGHRYRRLDGDVDADDGDPAAAPDPRTLPSD